MVSEGVGKIASYSRGGKSGGLYDQGIGMGFAYQTHYKADGTLWF